MRVKVDSSLCQAHAQCLIVAPDVFTLNEAQDIAVVLLEHPPESLYEDVRAAVRACPVQAISIVED